jgi:type VI secretion system protein ImpI
MALTFTIENYSQLPDGGPLTYTVTRRGFDLGRHTYLDWTLPDPNSIISGKHCEVRCLDGVYWLYDVSLNGTYLNGAHHRLLEPYRLCHGDRLCIGQYIIAVSLDDAGVVEITETDNVASENIWDFDGEVDSPIDPRELRSVKPNAATADFLDWAMDAPSPARDAASDRESDSIPPDESGSYWLPPPTPRPESVSSPSVPHFQPPVSTLDAPQSLKASDEVALRTTGAISSFEPVDRTDSSLPPAPVSSPLAGIEPAPTGNMEFVARFAAAAGLPAESLAAEDPGELGELLGNVIGIVVTEMWQLLEARRETKRMVRCANTTRTRAKDNNPLKFAPGPREALRQMFGPTSPAYLAAGPALHQGFADLAHHQIDTIEAMKDAVELLTEDLDPREIERAHGSKSGLSGLLGMHKAKLWDIYIERWRAKVKSYDDGFFGTYMDCFSKCYDRHVAKRT